MSLSPGVSVVSAGVSLSEGVYVNVAVVRSEPRLTAPPEADWLIVPEPCILAMHATLKLGV